MKFIARERIYEGSEEGNLQGFGWIKGHVRKFDKLTLKQKPYLPHLGWNTVELKKHNAIFDNIEKEQGFYFLHSYYYDCKFESDIIGTTEYGKTFASAINHENVFGMQFHPEKSHQNGTNIFKNFSRIE